MLDFIGIGLVVLGVLAVDACVPWFHRHQYDAVVVRLMLAESFALATMCLIVVGGSMIFVGMIDALAAGDGWHVWITVAVVVVLVAARRLAPAWRRARSPQA